MSAATTPPHTPFSLPVRVYWEDTDAGGVVFYANYLKFFERARTEWLRRLGLNQHTLREQTGGMFVVSSAQIKYHQPARLDDLLTVTAHIEQLGKASVVFAQEAYRHSDAAHTPNSTLLAAGSIRVGWVHAQTMQPGRIPAAVLAAMQAAGDMHTG
ncbi:MAG: tol-pal system-associated acyl-CoA thioesterase [Brachymonas sp.]|nr:tol-pal system-associated acyl-CoA thioesterase [Brachymonas sp.]MBP7247353.1 tol-pal system-associated acyl-CoA thioesterase [Brachymonas sp.]